MAGKYKKSLVPLSGGNVAVYATPTFSTAMDIVKEDMTIFQAAKLQLILETMYEQGKKDGARAAFEALHTSFSTAEKAIPHKNPGQPKKLKKK